MKKNFEVEVNGELLKLAVISASPDVETKAQQMYAKAWREAVEAGAILNCRIEEIMRQQGLWTDESQEQQRLVRQAIVDGEKKLAAGGIRKSEARKVAIDLRINRQRLQDFNMHWNSVEQNTAESQATNVRFNYYVSACTVYAETGERYYKDYDDYRLRENDPVAPAAAMAFGLMQHGLDPDFTAKLPENEFLKKYGFCDDKLRLIDKNGNRVDVDGNRLNEFGHRINDVGELVDEFGNVITDAGEYKVEFQPFIDDDEEAAE